MDLNSKLGSSSFFRASSGLRDSPIGYSFMKKRPSLKDDEVRTTLFTTDSSDPRAEDELEDLNGGRRSPSVLPRRPSRMK